MPTPLMGRELEIVNTVRTLRAQRQPTNPRHVAEVLNLSAGNVSAMMTRLIRKGHLERLGPGAIRERFTPPTVTPVRLKGTSRDVLSLSIELTGDNPRVLEDVNQALERLTWFKEQIERQMARERNPQ